MDRWTIDYVDELVRQVLERSFIERKRSVFKHSQVPRFNWDQTTGKVVRAWMFIRDNPSWLRKAPFDESTSQFAVLLGHAIERTTTTESFDQDSFSSLASYHASRQAGERALVTDFVNWSLQGAYV